MRRFAVLALLALTACPARHAPTAPGDDGLDQARLDRSAERMERDLAAGGLFYDEPALTAYLDGVARRLAPPGLGVRTRVLRTTDLNAFALPNGAIHLGVGLLARLDDEAQLAQVLAHEIVHLAGRHTEIAMRHRSSKKVATKLAGVVLAPTGFGEPAMGDVYAASVAGYGRELEEQADRDGLRLIAVAGYPLATVPHLFDEMQRFESPDLHTSYADHPAATARARTIRELIAVEPGPSADPRAAVYRRATAGVLRESIRLCLDYGEFKRALEETDTALAREGNEATLHFLAGEAHRGLALDRDTAVLDIAPLPVAEQRAALEARLRRELDAATAAYQRALALDPSLVAAHRGLGLVAGARGDSAVARRELETYLAGGGAVTDRRWIETVLRDLRP